MILTPRLFRQAGRPYAFMKRLTSGVQRASEAVRPAGSPALVDHDRRLAPLVGEADPFLQLDRCLARLEAGTGQEESTDSIVRGVAMDLGRRAASGSRMDAATTEIFFKPASGLGVSRQRPMEAARQGSPAQPFPVHGAMPAGPPLDFSSPEKLAPAGWPPAAGDPVVFRSVAPLDQGSSQSTRLDSREAGRFAAPPHGLADPAPHQTSAAPQMPAMLAGIDAARASEIIIERLSGRVELDAFRTPLRIRSISMDTAGPNPGRTSPMLPEEQQPAPARAEQPHPSPPAGPVRTTFQDGPLMPAGAGELTGLRRLAALATRQLDGGALDPAPGSPAGVVAIPPAAPDTPRPPLDQELARILRREALRHGIDPVGFVQ